MVQTLHKQSQRQIMHWLVGVPSLVPLSTMAEPNHLRQHAENEREMRETDGDGWDQRTSPVCDTATTTGKYRW